jgi:Holliday junction resolvase RusA-like endonuclease
MNITDLPYDELDLSSPFESGRPDKVTLEFPVEPLAVQSVRRGKFGFYSPPKVKAWKAAVAELARSQFKWDPYDGPIEVVRVQYRFPFPKTLKKATRLMIEAGHVFHMDRHCDLMDNLNKATMDALAGIIFHDDCRIVRCGGLEKIYSKDPGITVEFRNLEGKVNVIPR